MSYDTLIDAETLHAHLDDPGWIVVDCRFNLSDTEAGRRAYREGHIPGARYAHLDEDLSAPVTGTTGRHPLPEPERLAATLGAWGIDGASQVITYDDACGSIAARLWWLLRWLGHRNGAVLDGGLQAWRARGFPLIETVSAPDPASFPRNQPDNALWVDSDYVARNLRSRESLLVDARAVPRYRGESEPIDPVAGHVPGAKNLPLQGNLDTQGRFLPPERLRERFLILLGGRPPAAVVHLCGSGVTACHNLLAMETAGLTGSRLYAGSWSEWIQDPSHPVATGEG